MGIMHSMYAGRMQHLGAVRGADGDDHAAAACEQAAEFVRDRCRGGPDVDRCEAVLFVDHLRLHCTPQQSF